VSARERDDFCRDERACFRRVSICCAKKLWIARTLDELGFLARHGTPTVSTRVVRSYDYIPGVGLDSVPGPSWPQFVAAHVN